MLVVFIGGPQVLSTIARLSGGTYDSLPETCADWRITEGSYARLDDALSAKEETKLAEQYLTPFLRCGKPSSIDDRRWMLKALSNDQTGFSGFTALVNTTDSDEIGFADQIQVKPAAAFAEPFYLQCLDQPKKEELVSLTQQLQSCGSAELGTIEQLLEQINSNGSIQRSKGKSPVFFYGIADTEFALPRSFYDRMQNALDVVYGALNSETNNENGSSNPNAFTGSIDFMVYGNEIYVIDIGFPAVGLFADIEACSRVLGKSPDYGSETLAKAAGNNITVCRTKQELGFFRAESEAMIDQLRAYGVEVIEQESDCEVVANGRELPNPTLDYVSRNQPLREQVLRTIEPELAQLGVSIPQTCVMAPDDFRLARWYEQTRIGEDYGLVVKKKDVFGWLGDAYSNKPLVTPLWSRELQETSSSTLFEQFIPSLTEVDIAGDQKGKRAYEIRMYFVGDAQ